MGEIDKKRTYQLIIVNSVFVWVNLICAYDSWHDINTNENNRNKMKRKELTRELAK